MVAAKESYRAEMSIVRQFVEDRCDLGEGLWIETAKLYQAFKLYCDDNGHYLCSSRKFANDLTPFGVDNDRRKNARLKTGICLKGDAGDTSDFEKIEK